MTAPTGKLPRRSASRAIWIAREMYLQSSCVISAIYQTYSRLELSITHQFMPFRFTPHTVVFHLSRKKLPLARLLRRCETRQLPCPPLLERIHEERPFLLQAIRLLPDRSTIQTGPFS